MLATWLNAIPNGMDSTAAQGTEPVVVAAYQFEVAADMPTLHVERFSVTLTPGRRYTLVAENGQQDGSARVGNATVVLNGLTLFAPQGITASVGVADRPVDLIADNLLEVTVQGDPEAVLRVTLFSERDPSFVVYGPHAFVRAAGRPTAFTDAFAIAPTAAAPYVVHARNGAADGSHRVSSATILVNGSAAVTPADLNQQVDYVWRGVTLLADNTLDVTVTSQPEGYLTVWVTATDVTPPMLTLVTPPEQLFTNADEAEVAGTVEDETYTEVTVNGERVTVGDDGSFSVTVSLTVEGENAIEVVATDAAGFSSTVSRVVVYDPHPPVLTVNTPGDGLVTNEEAVTVSGTVFDDTPVDVNVNGVPLPVDGAGQFTGELTLAEGANVLTVTATDAAGNSVSVVRIVTLDTEPPVLVVTTPPDGSSTTEETVAVSGTVTDVTAVTVSVNVVSANVDEGTFTALVPLVEGDNALTVVATDAAGNTTTQTITVRRETPGGGLPPDPSTVAPALDLTVATTVHAATTFLYAGDSPIQTGVAPEAINPVRAAVIRGQVLDGNGDPLPGATITVLNHPEYGQTLSREDGWFDLAVNGGGRLTLDYELVGYLTVQRPVDVPWQDYAFADDAVMIPLDPQVTVVDLTATTVQVARGTPQTDEDGTRQATLLFMPGTTAEMVLPDGSTQPITSLSVRATEYTVGDLGPQRMPADLPPTNFYTYAAELSADEALAASARGVEFSQPVAFYVENFVGFSVGGPVPVGFYDRVAGEWVASDNGLVVEILGVVDGLAVLDLTGQGSPATPADYATFGISEGERQTLAGLYVPGTTLWRVPVTHFSPIDCNWPVKPPDDAENPKEPPPERDEKEDEECKEPGGSLIECRSQILGEVIPLTGTPYSLSYGSDRVPGRRAAYALNVSLSGSTVPASLKRIDLTIIVAGRLYRQSFPPGPDQRTTFTWDGRDAYGRILQGAQKAVVRLGYVYTPVYIEPDQFDFDQIFGQFFGSRNEVFGTRAANELVLMQVWEGQVGVWDARAQGFGGWTLSEHHAYDLSGQVLYLGDGRRQSSQSIGIRGPIIDKFAGGKYHHGYWGDGGPALEAGLNYPYAVEAGPGGSVYVADSRNYRVRRVDPEGIITTVVGTGVYGCAGDGGLATDAQIRTVRDFDVGADGTLWIADMGCNRIRKVGPDGIITTVAGTGYSDYWHRSYPCYRGTSPAPLSCPALEANITQPHSIVVVPDGSVYFSNYGPTDVLWRLGTDGILTTVVTPKCSGCPLGDGGPALHAHIRDVTDLAVGPDGAIYISDGYDKRIRRIDPSGIITTVAGIGSAGNSGDGGPATAAEIFNWGDIDVGSDGTLYFLSRSGLAESDFVRAVTPDGIISTIAGTIDLYERDEGYGGLARAAYIHFFYDLGLAAGPDGDLYLSIASPRHMILRISDLLPEFDNHSFMIAGRSGRAAYEFDALGRHLKTVGTMTGEAIHTFSYDAHGLLTSIEDRDGNVTSIERDADGNPVAIVGPYGHRTALGLDADGYLIAVTGPAGETVTLSSSTDGLLATETDPLGSTHRFFYDDLGRLIRNEDALGNAQRLARDGNRITYTSRANLVTTSELILPDAGGRVWQNTFPDGTAVQLTFAPDATRVLTTPSGLVQTTVEGPDPRWGMQAPLVQSQTALTPAGLERKFSVARAVQLADPRNPLSLTSQTTTATVNGRVLTKEFDAVARRMVITTPENRQQTMAFDEQGRVVEYSTPGLASTLIAYDARGRLVSVQRGSRTTVIAYDAEDNVSSVTDAASRVTGFEHDASGRLTARTAPDGGRTTFAYDLNDNVTALTPPDRPTHHFTYNHLDLRASYSPPDVGIGATATDITYDPDAKLLSVDRPDGQSLLFGYDAAGRLTTLTSPDGVFAVGYDGLTGQMVSMDTPDGVGIRVTRDAHLVTGEAWSGPVVGTVERVYDNDFRLVTQTVNGSSPVNFQYDQDGLLTGAGAAVLQRDATNGLLNGVVLDQAITSVAYNQFGERTSYDVSLGGTNEFSADYTYNNVGRLITKVEAVGGSNTTIQYSYDLAGRLEEVRTDGVVEHMYEYDLNGNRLRRVGAAGILEGTYDDQDRLLTYGTLQYTYSANGELATKVDAVSGESTTYQYDLFGNLRHVELPSGTTVDYVIDGNNRRIGKRLNGVLVQGWLYADQVNPVAELDGAGAVVTRFVYGSRPHVPEYLIRNGVTYQIVTDLNGSPRLVIDAATGAVIQRMEFDEFGNVILDTNPGFQPFGFAGGLYDRHTGLTRFGARDYDPVSGRFTAKDPTQFTGAETNLYVYAGNDPVNAVDLLGFEASLISRINAALDALRMEDLSGGASTSLAEIGARFEAELKDAAKTSDICRVMVNTILDLIGSDAVDALGDILDKFEQQDYDDRFDERGCPRPDATERIKKRRQEREKQKKDCQALLGT